MTDIDFQDPQTARRWPALVGDFLPRDWRSLSKRARAGDRAARVARRLALSDLAAYLAASLIAFALLWPLAPLAGLPFGPMSHELGLALLGAPLFLAACALVGLYARVGAGPVDRVRRRARAIGLYTAAIATMIGFSEPIGPALPVLAVKALLLLALTFFFESALRMAASLQSDWTAPTLVLGAPEATRAIVAFLSEHTELGFAPRAVLAETPEAQAAAAVAQLGAGDAASSQDAPAEAVILTNPADIPRLAAAWSAAGAGGAPAPRVFLALAQPDGAWSLNESGAAIGGIATIGVGPSPLHSRNARLLKRCIDVPIVLAASLVAGPLIAIAALAIALLDPGPVFYTQMRIGRDGKPFAILKLRSMYRDADVRLERHLAENPDARAEWARYFKLSDDPRILPGVGGLIRRASIDELPQVWNILRGDMSLIGPRPFPSYHLDAFDAEFQAQRASVPPGLTGFWQVTARSEGDLDVQKACDLYYIRNWSIWLDVYILLQTLPAVLSGRGAR